MILKTQLGREDACSFQASTPKRQGGKKGKQWIPGPPVQSCGEWWPKTETRWQAWNRASRVEGRVRVRPEGRGGSSGLAQLPPLPSTPRRWGLQRFELKVQALLI